MITVSLSGVEAVREQFEKIRGLSSKALAKTAVDVEACVTKEADRHTKTGALVQSVYSRRINADSWEIGHDLQRAPHAVFVHWGTKPHVIKPKSKKMLRWSKGGIFHFAKEVHHPGNKPDEWMKRAASHAPRMFAFHVDQLLKKA